MNSECVCGYYNGGACVVVLSIDCGDIVKLCSKRFRAYVLFELILKQVL